MSESFLLLSRTPANKRAGPTLRFSLSQSLSLNKRASFSSFGLSFSSFCLGTIGRSHRRKPLEIKPLPGGYRKEHVAVGELFGFITIFSDIAWVGMPVHELKVIAIVATDFDVSDHVNTDWSIPFRASAVWVSTLMTGTSGQTKKGENL